MTQITKRLMLTHYLLHLKQDLFGLRFLREGAILNDFSIFFQPFISQLLYIYISWIDKSWMNKTPLLRKQGCLHFLLISFCLTQFLIYLTQLWNWEISEKTCVLCSKNLKYSCQLKNLVEAWIIHSIFHLMLINQPFDFIGVHITRSGFNVLQESRNLNIEEKRK